MSAPLLPPSFLFRFSVPCQKKKLSTLDDVKLGEANVLPSFGELEGRTLFAEVRVGWSAAGMGFECRVVGKKQLPWCRATRLEDSDGLHVWIDTRDTHNVHRATRFCHRFALSPAGSCRRLNEPTAALMEINRAREHPKPVAKGKLQIASDLETGGYHLRAFVPADAMTGFDPAEHRRLGFTYAVIDRELGWQTLSIGPEFPIVEDPSLWGSLELVD